MRIDLPQQLFSIFRPPIYTYEVHIRTRVPTTHSVAGYPDHWPLASSAATDEGTTIRHVNTMRNQQTAGAISIPLSLLASVPHISATPCHFIDQFSFNSDLVRSWLTEELYSISHLWIAGASGNLLTVPLWSWLTITLTWKVAHQTSVWALDLHEVELDRLTHTWFESHLFGAILWKCVGYNTCCSIRLTFEPVGVTDSLITVPHLGVGNALDSSVECIYL